MQVSFQGICLWDKETRDPGLFGIMRNASAGEVVAGVAIPAHTACIIVRSDSVDDSQWSEPPQAVAFGGAPHSLYLLKGEDISFDPVPTGGAPDTTLLTTAGCRANRILDPTLTGNAPSAADVAARIDMPGTANFGVVRNDFGALLGILMTADDTDLVAHRFDGTVRRLSFTGNDPFVMVANVDLPLALADPGTADIDDQHNGLYCRMFVTPPGGGAGPAPSLRHGDLNGDLLFPFDVGDAARIRESVRAVANRRRPTRGPRFRGFLTLGAGCSNSQYP